MKTGSLPVSYTDTGLLFADGSHLKADVLVFATGFLGNLRDIVRQMFGDKVADKAGDCWGVDDEGEIKGAFKPLGRMLYPPSPFLYGLLVLMISYRTRSLVYRWWNQSCKILLTIYCNADQG